MPLKGYFALCVCFLALLSCSKETEVIIKNQTGITIQLVDNQNQPIPDIDVRLFDHFENEFHVDNFFYQGKTDAEGMINLADTKVDLFRLVTDSVHLGRFAYVAKKDYQAIRGKENVFQLNVESFADTLTTYSAVAYAPVYESKPASDFQIAILPYGYVGEWDKTISEEVLEKALYKEFVGKDGYNRFYLPISVYYNVVVYEPATLRLRYVGDALSTVYPDQNALWISMTIYPD